LRATGDRKLLVEALSSGTWNLALLSRADEALRAVEEAVRVAESMDHPGTLTDQLGPMATHLEQLGTMAWIYEERGEYEQGRRVAERALALAEKARDPVRIIFIMSRLGLDAFLSGDWPKARVYLERGVAIPQQVGIREGFDYIRPHCDLARLLHAEGAWDEATRYFEEVLAAFAGTGERILTLVAHGHLAERDVLAGHPEAACARLLPLLDRTGVEERMVTHFILPVLAWALFELGELDEAAATAAETIRRARSGLCRLALVQALRVQARVLLARDRYDEAACTLEDGLAVARSMPYPHGEGRLLQVYGLLHARQRQPAQASERTQEALAIFRRLGARKDVERIEQSMTVLD
jgi:tetratricopeptide (TPR) repeat protein